MARKPLYTFTSYPVMARKAIYRLTSYPVMARKPLHVYLFSCYRLVNHYVRLPLSLL